MLLGTALRHHSICTGDAGDAAVKAAFEEIVAPAAHRFKPDIVLVGFTMLQYGPTWIVIGTDQG